MGYAKPQRYGRPTRVTSLSQTALEFVREVLGYEDAKITGGREWIGYNWQIDPIDPAESGCALFDYGDLNTIMKAVEDFCSRHGLFMSCCRSPGAATWQATIFRHGLETTLGVDYPTLGHALLAACVEASRRLNGQ
jgi:hypothetical protein